MDTQLARKIRQILTAEDGAAFSDRTKDYAPRSGEDYRPGFVLLVGRESVAVTSALPSGYADRARHMGSYAAVLKEAGLNVRATWKGDRCTAVTVRS